MVIAIDDEQMPIAARPEIEVAGLAVFDPVRLCDRLVGNWVKRKALVRGVVHAVAFVRVVELNCLLRERAVDYGVGKAVNLNAAGRDVAAEVRMHAARRSVVDERHVARRCSVDRRGREDEVPPIVRGEERQRTGERASGSTRRPHHDFGACANRRDNAQGSIRRSEKMHPGPQSKHRAAYRPQASRGRFSYDSGTDSHFCRTELQFCALSQGQAAHVNRPSR